MTVITFTSDFGLRDTTVARVKARFMRRVKDLLMVDVSHLVEPHNITEAAFMLSVGYIRDFPPVYDPLCLCGCWSTRKQGVYMPEGQLVIFFIGVNNGILAKCVEWRKNNGRSCS